MAYDTLWVTLARHRPQIHRRGRWRRWRRVFRALGRVAAVYAVLLGALLLLALMW